MTVAHERVKANTDLKPTGAANQWEDMSTGDLWRGGHLREEIKQYKAKIKAYEEIGDYGDIIIEQ